MKRQLPDRFSDLVYKYYLQRLYRLAMHGERAPNPVVRRLLPPGIFKMPYVLLEHLLHAQLPVDILAAEEIHKLLSLKAAGLVVAEIPAFSHDRNGGSYASAARVLAVTPAGVAAIKKRKV